jgi:dihydrofolate reductase
MERDYKIIVAYDSRRGIGYNNSLPWHIPEDIKRFKTLTMGSYVVMGSKSFISILNSLGKPLPGRTNVVLSRKLEKLEYDNCLLFNNILDVLDNVPKAWILGGHDIFQAFMPYVNEIYATEIEKEYTCDVFFPEIDMQQWQGTDIQQRDGYRFINYVRK